MATKTVFDQKRRQAAAAASLLESLLFQATHHATWQGDVEPFGFSCFSHLCGGYSWLIRLKALLEFLQESAQD